jgi:t-SNARE complex subunit (syntaxin)
MNKNLFINYIMSINVNSEDTQLLNDVELLGIIFNDINKCIIDQGKKINRIENNISKTEDTINLSNEQLLNANYYKKEINKKYLTLAGIGSIIIYLFIL